MDHWNFFIELLCIKIWQKIVANTIRNIKLMTKCFVFRKNSVVTTISQTPVDNGRANGLSSINIYEVFRPARWVGFSHLAWPLITSKTKPFHKEILSEPFSPEKQKTSIFWFRNLLQSPHKLHTMKMPIKNIYIPWALELLAPLIKM